MNHLTLTLCMLFVGVRLAGAERAGLNVEMPKDWKQAVGTCTGELTCFYPDIKSPQVALTIASQRYRDRDAEYISTGAWRDFYEFDNVLSHVSQVFGSEIKQMSVRRITTTSFKNVFIGALILVPTGSEAKRQVRFAAIETGDAKEILFIQCYFDALSEELADRVFEKALVSVIGENEAVKDSKIKGPNKALVPTVMSVTPAADAPVAPAKTAAHL
jgi:hypothetical protein